MYTIRKECIFCKNTVLNAYFEQDHVIPQNIGMIDNLEQHCEWIPYNVQYCENCHCYQNKYLGDLSIVYQKSHIQPIGKIRQDMNQMFTDLILKNKDISHIIEIGGGSGELADSILNCTKIPYTIIDPSYIGNRKDRTVIEKYVETEDLNCLKANTLVMSHVFEHFYEPMNILHQIENTPCIEYIYICHPDFIKYVQNEPYTYNCLTIEHTYFIQNEHVIELFRKIGYQCIEQLHCHDYAVIYAFKKNVVSDSFATIKRIDLNDYFSSLISKVNHYNKILEESITPVYIWPCSIHSISLFNMGLNYTKLSGILDNASSKIGNYMYGHKLLCHSFQNMLEDPSPKTILLSGGCFNKEISTGKYSHIQFII